MSLAETLRGIGDDLKTGAKAVGAVAQPVLQRTAEVVSGEAPQSDEEQRRRAEEMEDAQINAKAQILEDQLAEGQKYGTLTPDQQQQYIDKITGLYNKPRHAPLLMERLRKAIHPNGAVAPTPTATRLPNAIPPGGTAAADEAVKEKEETRKLANALTLIDERAAEQAKYRKPAGKSPPLPGSQLPIDAVGPDGNPIPESARNAGQSFVEYQGAWWPVAKPKPILRTLQGHLVMIDPGTHDVIKDYGPQSGAKVTRRQTLQPGDDGQMHLVTLTSVTTPEGASIEVQPEEASETEGSPSAGGGGSNHPSSAPKTPAKKVGSILPKTGARPAGSGNVVPGFSKLAKSKSPLFKSDVTQYTKASEDARAKKMAFENAQGLLNDKNRKTDLELVYAWVRANVQGAGRMTNTEIQQTATAGSWGTRVANWMAQAQTGRLTPELEQQFFGDIKRSYENAQREADDLKNQLGAPASPPPSGTGDPAVDKFLRSF